MLTYWWMYLLPASMTILISGPRKQQYWTSWILIGLLFILLIGYRHEVGGDWFNYFYQYQRIARISLDRSLLGGDPGYVFLNWLMASWGWGIYGVNLVAAILSSAGKTLASFNRISAIFDHGCVYGLHTTGYGDWPVLVGISPY